MSGIVQRLQKQQGFTIVELLIVIVVVAILAAISIVAYNGIQQRARDSQRKNDIETIVKALELYYVDNGEFPSSTNGSTSGSSNWSTTANSSWQGLASYLVPKYISKMPSDPTPSLDVDVLSSTLRYGYLYYANPGGMYCGVASRQFYLLVYRLESGSQENTLVGDCGGTEFPPRSDISNYRMVK